MIDRELLLERQRAEGPESVVRLAKKLGYKRGRFANGLEVIVTADGKDWIYPPMYSMRQATGFLREFARMPQLEMPCGKTCSDRRPARLSGGCGPRHGTCGKAEAS